MRILCEPWPTVVLTLSLSKGEDGRHDASTPGAKTGQKIGASEEDAPRDPARHREVYGRAIEPK